jgi:hypothetical protein
LGSWMVTTSPFSTPIERSQLATRPALSSTWA